MSYSQKLLQHFEYPRNVGDLPDASAEVRLEHPVCGDIMKLAIKVEDGRIVKVRYQTRGCVASIAAGSCLTELIEGKSLQQAAALTREELVDSLGGLSSASVHAAHLAIDALHRALEKIK